MKPEKKRDVKIVSSLLGLSIIVASLAWWLNSFILFVVSLVLFVATLLITLTDDPPRGKR